MFVLVVILGVFLGWLGVQLKWIHDRHEAMNWILRHHSQASIDHQGSAPWSLRILGEVGIRNIRAFGADSLGTENAHEQTEVQRLFPEAEICMNDVSLVPK
jgi:hypothetical protein